MEKAREFLHKNIEGKIFTDKHNEQEYKVIIDIDDIIKAMKVAYMEGQLSINEFNRNLLEGARDEICEIIKNG